MPCFMIKSILSAMGINVMERSISWKTDMCSPDFILLKKKRRLLNTESRLGWVPEGRFGEQDIAWLGTLAEPADLVTVSGNVARLLGREPLVIGEAGRPVRRIAWCSGGAQGYFEQAIALGVDAYVSGEISEQTVHLARESGVAYIAAGHHATERGGVQALAAHLSEKFGLDCEFVDIENPV